MKAVLFDLDGTLLPMDTDAFVKEYLAGLAPKLQHLLAPDAFIKALWKATGDVVQSTDQRTNQEVFTESFLSLTKLPQEEIVPILDQFYQNDFYHFGYMADPTPLAAILVEGAARHGYRTALATNPVFPEAAVHHRISWAGLTPSDFDIISTYENSTAAKPNPAYYREIADKLNVSPEECVMIGNDAREDGAAQSTGMKTILISTWAVKNDDSFTPDMEGSLEEVIEALHHRRGVFSV
ncbi:HAD family hydrolase [Alkalicoccus urumqiensis]|uniref:HAD family hydrolase n=1 Tax=Alkalicoccus urumqiensis TaxID=1548213 RepID=A0A2P6MKU0_ALKUR|nr:HAD family hydrolase [Alkalicoccus urumqiensis]PRO66896.1 HAD family hydrolase [Alkalicoccus urumqiensis]